MTEGQIIQEARRKAGYSQLEVARKLGYSHAQFISNIERGRALLPLTKLRRFSVLVGRMPVKHLIDLRVARFRERLEKELE